MADTQRRLHQHILMLARVLEARRNDDQGHYPQRLYELMHRDDDSDHRQEVAIQLQDELRRNMHRVGLITLALQCASPHQSNAFHCVWCSDFLSLKDTAALSVAWLSAAHVSRSLKVKMIFKKRRDLLRRMHAEKRQRGLEARVLRGAPVQFRARQWLRRLLTLVDVKDSFAAVLSVQFLLGVHGPRLVALQGTLRAGGDFPLPFFLLAHEHELHRAQIEGVRRQKDALFSQLIRRLSVLGHISAKQWRCSHALGSMAARFVDPQKPVADLLRGFQRFAFTRWVVLYFLGKGNE